MERMMKLQEVILKAMAKKISWIDAAEIAGMSVRNMQRKRQAYEEFGYTGLYDQRRGKRSTHRVAMKTAEKVLELYRAELQLGEAGAARRRAGEEAAETWSASQAAGAKTTPWNAAAH
jgi:hypothetical protein